VELVVILAWGELIRAVYSDDPRRRMWGADKILSSWLARDHPLSPARGFATGRVDPREIIYRWRTSADDKRDAEAAEAERLRSQARSTVA
jgi:hypothetical protein